MIRLKRTARHQFAKHLLVFGGLFALLALNSHSVAANDAVQIPPNIVTNNVPSLPGELRDRLQRYGNVRSAYLYGWQDDALLISTRFGQTSQLHRVATPQGARSQLTFLPEPLADVAIPVAGAKEQILISWDVGGSEFDQMFLFNLKDGSSKLVSDGKSLYANMIWAPDEQSFVYVTTERNGTNWDVHRQQLSADGSTKKEVLLQTDAGYWFPIDYSKDGKRLLVKHRVSINQSAVYELDIASGQLTKLLGDDKDQMISIGHAAYDGHGGVLFTSDDGREFLTLQRLKLKDKSVRPITADVPWDVEQFVISADYSRVAFSVNSGGVSKVNVRTLPELKAVKTPNLPNGIVGSLAFSPESTQLALTINSATAPSDVYSFVLGKSDLTRWTTSEVGGLDRSKFADVKLIEYPSFDGRNIPAFYYQPNTPGPHPVVVYIHGGPESQYRPYFSTLVQSYVAQMDVAVIAPNVRGSNGYGKSYLQLDNGKLREDSVKDIGALLDWIATQDDLREDAVAVYGGSYGGYMVLASMVHYGDRLAAAVESVGISNFVTFLENTQAYRQDMRRVEYGDERDPDMRAHLENISPLNHVDKMVTPLLISQGANDPRVPASESDQIFAALEKAGVPAWYVLAKDEGHGFRKKVNRDYDRVAKFAFLEYHLKSE